MGKRNMAEEICSKSIIVRDHLNEWTTIILRDGSTFRVSLKGGVWVCNAD